MQPIGRILRWAWPWLLDADPTDGLRCLRVEDQDLRVPSAEEAGAWCRPSPRRHRFFVYTVVSFGLRVGEAVAIPLDAVDTKAKTLHIRQAARLQENGGITLAPPKTREANRFLPIPDGWAAAYTRHLERPEGMREPRWPGLPRSRAGKVRYPGNMRTRVLKPALEAAGLPIDWAWHRCRHMFAGVALTLADLQARLGHTDHAPPCGTRAPPRQAGASPRWS